MTTTLNTHQSHTYENQTQLLLSGGLDSSYLGSFFPSSSQVIAQNVSYSMPTSSSYDESRKSRRIAKSLGFKLNETILSHEVCDLHLDDILSSIDHPFIDPSIIPTYAAMNAASKLGRVVFTGDGADELFAGYETFIAQRVPTMPSPMHCLVSRGSKSRYFSLSTRIIRHRAARHHTLVNKHRIWLSPDPELSSTRIPAGSAQSQTTEELLQLYMNGWLASCLLRKLDTASMANNIEARSPFLDWRWWNGFGHQWEQRVLEWGLKLPLRRAVSKRFNGSSSLRLLFDKKHGFGFPVNSYFQSSPRREELFSWANNGQSFLAEQNIISPTEIRELHHRHPGSYSPRMLWGLTVLGHWRQRLGLN